MKHLPKIFLALVAATLCIASSACRGSSSHGTDIDSLSEPEIIVEKADSPAYYMGEKAARLMLRECTTTSDIRDRLLDLRSREHILRTQVSQSAADAYIIGIENTIRNSGDTLAQAILSH